MGGYDEVLATVSETVRGLEGRPNVQETDPSKVRERAQRFARRTEFGNYAYASVVKNRSANLTVYVGSRSVLQESLNPRQQEILEAVPETVRVVGEYVKRAPLVRSVRQMGANEEFSPLCVLYVSTQRPEVIRLAHFFNLALPDPGPPEMEPRFWLVDLPEWQEKDRQILVFPEMGVTYVLGSDYYGEVKKGFLRMGMWHAKQRGMLGVHAGAKIVRARGPDGRVRRQSMYIFGLTATGKTTHTAHTHDLDGEGEGIEIAQDDVVFIREDWSALGTERGFFLKTEGVDPTTQPLIHRAVTQEDAVFENVMVDHERKVEFDDLTLTGNGRGIMQRTALGDFMGPMNIPSAHELDGTIVAFITRRNTIMPMAAKLTPEQAAAAFMLGESVESTGGDPRRAGMSVREVGTNPFIIGDKAEEGNRFYAYLREGGERVQGYLLNTGGVGEIARVEDGKRVVERKVERIPIPEMASIIRGVARDTIQWDQDRFWKVLTPQKVPGMDIGKYDPENYYPEREIQAMVDALRKERRAYLGSFQGLDPTIVKKGIF